VGLDWHNEKNRALGRCGKRRRDDEENRLAARNLDQKS
jgi:hypothetical protein